MPGPKAKRSSWLDESVTHGHWRTYANDEVDLVIDRDEWSLFAFEVKAGTRVPGGDLAPLKKLRGLAGDAFIAGVVLYPGERSYTLTTVSTPCPSTVSGLPRITRSAGEVGGFSGWSTAACAPRTAFGPIVQCPGSGNGQFRRTNGRRGSRKRTKGVDF